MFKLFYTDNLEKERIDLSNEITDFFFFTVVCPILFVSTWIKLAFALTWTVTQSWILSCVSSRPWKSQTTWSRASPGHRTGPVIPLLMQCSKDFIPCPKCHQWNRSSFPPCELREYFCQLLSGEPFPELSYFSNIHRSTRSQSFEGSFFSGNLQNSHSFCHSFFSYILLRTF